MKIQTSQQPIDVGKLLAVQATDCSINANGQSKASLNLRDKGPLTIEAFYSIEANFFFLVCISKTQFEQLKHQLFTVKDNLSGAANKIV